METSTPSAGNTRRTAILLVAVAFVAGALIGFAGGRAYTLFHGPRPRAELMSRRILDHLDHELTLTAQQYDRIKEIMDRHHRRMMEISEGLRPQMHQEVEAANREVDAVLTPEQREKFQKMRMRFHGPRGFEHDGPPPMPPPPNGF